MKFNSLKIERERWGKDEGKLKSVLDISSKDGNLTLFLPDDVGEKILQLAKQAIIDGVEETANSFIFDITTHIPNKLNLETK